MPEGRGLRAPGHIEGAAGVCSARLRFRGSPPRSLGVQCRTAVMRHLLLPEEHEVRGQRRERGERHVRGPSGGCGRARTDCTKGLSCGIGGEDCHVVTVMRDHVGTYQRTQKAGWEFHLNLGRCHQGHLRKMRAHYARRAGAWMRSLHGGGSGSQSVHADAQGEERTGGSKGLVASREVGSKPHVCLVFRW